MRQNPNAKEALRKARTTLAKELKKHPTGLTLDMIITITNKNSEANCDLYAFRNRVRFIPKLPKSFQLDKTEKDGIKQ